MTVLRRLQFARARWPVAVAMRAVAAALPADEAGRGRRSVFSARAHKLAARWRDGDGR